MMLLWNATGRQKNPEALREVSKAHRRSVALSLDEYRMRHPNNDEAMAQAYLSGAYTMAQIGQHFGVHYMTVSRAVRKLGERPEGDVVMLELTPNVCPRDRSLPEA
jgi:transposase-like protein